jgi:calcineurin-like phosphoesterase family protein
MTDTWVISDTHFNHAKILDFKDYIGKPARSFDSADHMNQCMMDNWVSVVKPNDTVIHCGDVLFGMDKVDWMTANFAKLPRKDLFLVTMTMLNSLLRSLRISKCGLI